MNDRGQGDPGNTPDPDVELTEDQTDEQDAIIRERLGLLGEGDDADR